jgi:hypothetical protein
MVVREIAWRDPLEAFAPLAGEPFAALLHAGESAPGARWSVLAALPSSRLEVRAGSTFIDEE